MNVNMFEVQDTGMRRMIAISSLHHCENNDRSSMIEEFGVIERQWEDRGGKRLRRV